MMASTTQQHSSQARRFWTARRLTFTLIALALLSVITFSSCTQSENVATTSGNAPPSNTTASSAVPGQSQPPTVIGPNAPTKNVAPPANPSAVPFVPLPPALLETRLTTIDGKSLKLSDYKGKVVIINLWASWCGPCRIETPELVRMSREYKERGVEFIGLTTMQNDPDPEPIKDFVREQQVPYKIVYDNGSFAGPLAQAVRARAVIPQSYVISRDGNILKHFEGFNAEQTPRLLREAIEQALNYKGQA